MAIPLQLSVLTAADGPLLVDWSSYARDVEFGTNEHGFADLTCSVPLSPIASYWWFNRPGLPWIEVWGDNELAWRGRIEDIRLIEDGISLVALGAWSVLGDVPYTATPTSPEAPDDIVKAILAAARVDNPTFLSDYEGLIEAPGTNMYDEEYVDADMRKILVHLAAAGDSQTPPRQWEVGIWEDSRLHFRPRSSAARHWYAELAMPEIERSISTLYNSVYTRYNGGASTTANADDAASIARYGVTRRRAVSSQTTDTTQAERERDAALADSASPVPRASVPLDRILTALGVPVPLWMVRSGDTLTLRNLPAEAGDIIDRIRTFRIAETRYRTTTNTLNVVPESPLPLLEVMVSRALEVPA